MTSPGCLFRRSIKEPRPSIRLIDLATTRADQGAQDAGGKLQVGSDVLLLEGDPLRWPLNCLAFCVESWKSIQLIACFAFTECFLYP